MSKRTKTLQEPAYRDRFEDGYEHALKDAHDRLCELGHHDAAVYIGDMQGEYGATIAKQVRKNVRERRAAKKARKRG